MIDGLTFEATEHRYLYQGKPVINVTRALDELVDYSMVAPSALETARQKGTAVHKMVELYARDDLDEASLPDWMRPALEAWKKFQEQTGFRIIESEFRVFHPSYQYAGTGDLYGEMVHAGEFAHVDLKRSLMAGSIIGLQLAGYKDAYREMITDIEKRRDARNAKRYALRLSEKGPPRLQEYADPRDLTDFLTCLNYRRLQEKLHVATS